MLKLKGTVPFGDQFDQIMNDNVSDETYKRA